MNTIEHEFKNLKINNKRKSSDIDYHTNKRKKNTLKRKSYDYIDNDDLDLETNKKKKLDELDEHTKPYIKFPDNDLIYRYIN